MTIEILNRGITPTHSQMSGYKLNTTSIRREQTPNLRFGKLAIASDADVDGQ